MSKSIKYGLHWRDMTAAFMGGGNGEVAAVLVIPGETQFTRIFKPGFLKEMKFCVFFLKLFDF